MNASIRAARVEDLAGINRIYNHYIDGSTATYAEAPMSQAERLAWWHGHEGRYPVLVAEGGNGELLGWASASEYRPRAAYRFTVEDSVYLRPDLPGRGLGTQLLRALLEASARRGFRTMLAFISADQQPSLAVHRKAGFVDVGCLRRIGFKFGRWLDVAILQVELAAAADDDSQAGRS